MTQTKQIKVAIIGAGISGLTVANGLLHDIDHRFDVQIYERDTVAFDSERGGYQLRIGTNGLKALKTVSTEELWSALRQTWRGDATRAPALVEPKHFTLCLDLAKYPAYPTSRSVPRVGLRRALLQPLLEQNRVQFSHRVEKFEFVDNGNGGVVIYFKNGQTTQADILIAADGSGSKINQQVGLNNKLKLSGWTLIQSRAVVDEATYKSLPKSLLESGSVLFLGGQQATGFASIYDQQQDSEHGKTWNVFWSAIIPKAKGESIIAQANGDNKVVIDLLLDYFRRDLGYGEELPTVITSATDYVRTGALTSSRRPTTNWRDGVEGNERVILLGDAVHPMTPGRGMGANQALTDAGNLVLHFKQARFSDGKVASGELATLVKEFEAEMYDRAFDMVKKSEQLTALDLSHVKGRLIISFAGIVLIIVGWGFAVLEAVGLKEKPDEDYNSLKP